MARVAIVEGESAPAAWMQRLLELDEGLDVVHVASGFRQAAAVVPAKPDIVLVDCDLADGDGVELAGRLARVLPHAKVYGYMAGPPRDLPDEVGLLRLEDLHLWRRFLTEPPENSSLLVRHPSR